MLPGLREGTAGESIKSVKLITPNQAPAGGLFCRTEPAAIVLHTLDGTGTRDLLPLARARLVIFRQFPDFLYQMVSF